MWGIPSPITRTAEDKHDEGQKKLIHLFARPLRHRQRERSSLHLSVNKKESVKIQKRRVILFGVRGKEAAQRIHAHKVKMLTESKLLNRILPLLQISCWVLKSTHANCKK
jgi:hypothetical protein